MKKTTKLRVVGAAILVVNLVLIGRYNIEGILAILMTFGFAIGYEYLIVRSAKSKTDNEQ